MAVEQQFARYLLDQIDSEMEEIPAPMQARIKVPLDQLRGIIDEVFGTEQTSARRTRRGGANA